MPRLCRLLCFAGLSLALLSGCVPVPPFKCSGNDSCVTAAGVQGLCEENSRCSFPDDACPGSRRRLSEVAGVTGTCVPAGKRCVQQLSLGANHSCLLRDDGTVYCWGDNTDGKLGDGTTIARSVPTAVQGLPTGAVSIGAGEYHTCAVLKDDSVWCWGGNDAYELGLGTNTMTSSPTPVRVLTTSDLPDGGQTDPVPLAARSLAVGGAHTCAVSDGTALCWGENQSGGHGGQCGRDPALYDDVRLARAVVGLGGVIEVSTGDEFTCARKDDSSVWCWGVNANGELGNGGTDSFVPVGNGLTSVKSIEAGDEHVCVQKADSSVWCWGYGGAGSIGNGSFEDQKTPTRITSATSVYSGGTAFVTCVVDAAGSMYCWGGNDSRQTATASTADNVVVPTPTTLVTVSRAALGAKHGCATTLDGALWCWGSNEEGQLGIGSAGPIRAVPVRVQFSCP